MLWAGFWVLPYVAVPEKLHPVAVDDPSIVILNVAQKLVFLLVGDLRHELWVAGHREGQVQGDNSGNALFSGLDG
jgi:hypothetical protein